MATSVLIDLYNADYQYGGYKSKPSQEVEKFMSIISIICQNFNRKTRE